MRKYWLCSILSIIMLWIGVSAGAADTPAIPTAAELLQNLPAEVRQKAENGIDPAEMQFIDCGEFSLHWGENDGSTYIVQLLFERSGTYLSPYGVFDFTAGEWRIPCEYQQILRLPDRRYFLLREDGDDWRYYEASPDGTIDPQPLPFDGRVGAVDAEGYITLYRTVRVPSPAPEYADQEAGSYVQMALLDAQYRKVLDYIAEDLWLNPISFQNGVAVIRTGSTKQEFAGPRAVSLIGSTYGLIDRKGEWVGAHDYTDMHRSEYEANNRVFAERGNQFYWIAEDGAEIPLSGSPSELAEQSSGWARDAIEQAKSRGLIPESVAGYYTLDILREEFCALLMKVYHALGKEPPALDNAPTFTDCDSADVRAIAALEVVSGYEDGAFRPRSCITREEAAAILSRFIALFQGLDETAYNAYQDDAAIGSWAKPQVYAMQNAGIMNGVSDGVFAPKNTYTIEQAVSVINRLYDLLMES